MRNGDAFAGRDKCGEAVANQKKPAHRAGLFLVVTGPSAGALMRNGDAFAGRDKRGEAVANQKKPAHRAGFFAVVALATIATGYAGGQKKALAYSIERGEMTNIQNQRRSIRGENDCFGSYSGCDA